MNEQLDNHVQSFANAVSATRLKLSTINFDREYRRDGDGNLCLVSEKAIIRVLGKVSKVPIGEGQEYATYEEAFEGTKKRWSGYYKEIRANRSPEQIAAERKRQKRYRERRKARRAEVLRQQ